MARGRRGSTHTTPRWVKVFAIIGIVVVVAVVLMLVFGGGGHGPERHLGGDAPASAEAQGHASRSAGL